MVLLKKKHIISDKILGSVAQASKDGYLLIILISFLYKNEVSCFLTISKNYESSVIVHRSSNNVRHFFECFAPLLHIH